MRLSVHTDLALRTLMFLAANDGQHSIAEISTRYGISKNHMMKVAQRLVAKGFVKSVRGVISPVCGLRHVFADAIESFLEHLDGYTVADMVGDKDKFVSVWL